MLSQLLSLMLSNLAMYISEFVLKFIGTRQISNNRLLSMDFFVVHVKFYI